MNPVKQESIFPNSIVIILVLFLIKFALVSCADTQDSGQSCEVKLDEQKYQSIAENTNCSNYERGSGYLGQAGTGGRSCRGGTDQPALKQSSHGELPQRVLSQVRDRGQPKLASAVPALAHRRWVCNDLPGVHWVGADADEGCTQQGPRAPRSRALRHEMTRIHVP